MDDTLIVDKKIKILVLSNKVAGLEYMETYYAVKLNHTYRIKDKFNLLRWYDIDPRHFKEVL
jgi:hypothetical protein